MACCRPRVAVALATVLCAFSAAGAAIPLKDLDKLLLDKLPEQIQAPVVAVVEVATSVDRRTAEAFREYVTRERPAQHSVFRCFKLVPAKSMNDAKTIASKEGSLFILRVLLLRRVVSDKAKDANTGKMLTFYNSDARLELWMPSTSKAAPRGSWRMKSSCMAQNYNPKSPGMTLMDAGSRDSTDKPDMPSDFGVIGDRILSYLQRSVLEIKKVTVERAPDGGASARVELVNHADIPVENFSLILGARLCDVSYDPKVSDGKPLPPGEGEIAIPIRLTVGSNEKIPPDGPCSWKVNYLSFGMIGKPSAYKDAAAEKREGKP